MYFDFFALSGRDKSIDFIDERIERNENSEFHSPRCEISEHIDRVRWEIQNEFVDIILLRLMLMVMLFDLC
jgi:hypothetical protein